METWLILDVSCLVYRSFYAMGDLSYDGVKTGGVFGFLRDLMDLQELFSTKRVVFCFDSPPTKRKRIFPGYKSSRRKPKDEMTVEETAVLAEIQNQLLRLRVKYLPYIGFRNILWEQGYEADDLIASACSLLSKGAWIDREEVRDSIVVVSSDSDMYQLLDNPQVTIWNPRTRKPFTANSFRELYGIEPSWWARVKAIGGCSSDDVPGVPGVGEKTAIKFLRGRLGDHTKAYQKIMASEQLIERYLRLTKLPYRGTPRPKLREDGTTRRRWERALEKLGMDSLRGRAAGVKKR